MASNGLCVLSPAYSAITRAISRKRVAFRDNNDPSRKILRCKSIPLQRIMIVARSAPQAQGKISGTVGSGSITVEPQNRVDDVKELHSSTGTVYMPPVSMKNWNLTDQHLFLLSTIACVTAAMVTALFAAAIPTLLAFKRAAESLEKLLEVTREELPGTMAAVRLSGMEISDLTMELSELGQDISSGVKSSARAVCAAQDGLRRISNVASTGAQSTSSRVNEASSGASSKKSS